MLIVEGTDLVGKTTLCHKLVKELNHRIGGYQYQHFSRLPEGWDYYWSYVNRMCRRVVQDRFHDSELAYTYGRGEDSCAFSGSAGHVQYQLVEAKLRLLGCLKVVIIAPDGTIDRRFAEKGDDMYDVRVIQRANNWFEENAHRFDYVCVCEDGQYPEDGLVMKLADEYMLRQNLIEHILNRHHRHGL